MVKHPAVIGGAAAGLLALMCLCKNLLSKPADDMWCGCDVTWRVAGIFLAVRRKKKKKQREDEERLRRENSDDTINQAPSRNRTFTGIGGVTPTPRHQRDMDNFLDY